MTRRSTYRSTKRVSRAVGLAVLLKASPARADVLVPATFVVYGYLFELHLAPAILLVETIIARRVLGLSWARSLLVAGAANAASTAAGLLLVLPMTIWMSVRGSLEAGAFLVLMLCLPLCAASIWMEGRVAARLLRRTHTREQCARWARVANTASYVMIAAISVAVIVASWLYRKRGWI